MKVTGPWEEARAECSEESFLTPPGSSTVNSTLTPEPIMGLDSMTLRSQPKWTLNQLSHPGTHPAICFNRPSMKI